MEKELKLKTRCNKAVSSIRFGRDFALKNALKELLGKGHRQVAVITDYHLEKLYHSELAELDIEVLSFQPGEASKTRKAKEVLEDQLLSRDFGRDCLLIALGGGVVGDVVGFLAATYCRGVAYIQIPTSLLAMVDASVGGKTGVNTPHGKNMIGAFYPPSEVWIDAHFLSTLPTCQWTSGLVEMIKAGLIASPALFDALRLHSDAFRAKDLDFILDRIFESVAIKREIVQEDPDESKGLRRILNLGHTFGHALETMEHYTLSHGSAVAMGILGSCYASNLLGYLCNEAFEQVKEIFRIYEVELTYRNSHKLDAWIAQLARDKKSLCGTARIVMIDAIGSAMAFDSNYCDALDSPSLNKTLNWMHEQFYRPS